MTIGLIAALALAAGASGGGVPPPQTCDPEFRSITMSRQLYDASIARSLEIVTLATNDPSNPRLARLVGTSGEFSLGAGDANRPFGSGAEAAKQFAATLGAATYFYPGYDYMDYPIDPCSESEVEIEFVTADGQGSADVTFKYMGGKLVSAAGWQRSRNGGSIK